MVNFNHPAGILKLLEEYGELEETNLRTYHVYGSGHRPISGIWARIPFAVYINTTKDEEGFHSFVATPGALDAATIASYELTPVSPAPLKPARVVTINLIELECSDPACKGPCIDPRTGSYQFGYDVEEVKCERCGTVQPVPSGIFDLSNVRFRAKQ